MNHLFEGVCPVINTPFTASGEIDLKGIDSIVEYVLESGCTSIALFALNSEPHKMSHQEKYQVMERFLGAVSKRAETMIGVIENSVPGAIEFAARAKELGADGIILYPPSIATPSGPQLLDYFSKISGAVDIPVVIQDAPRTTGVTMSTEFILDAFYKIKNFKYIKVECPLPVHKLNTIVERTDNGLKCLSGNGGIFTVDSFVRGAWGVMPGIGLVKHFVEIWNAFKAKNMTRARDIFENMLPLLWFEDQSLEFFISCEKEILHRKGVIESSFVRVPEFALDTASMAELAILYGRLREV